MKGSFPSPDSSGPGCISRPCRTLSPLCRFDCLKVWLGPGQLRCGLAATWDQGTGKGAVWHHLGEAPSGADPFIWEVPVLRPLPLFPAWVLPTPCLSPATGPVGPNLLIRTLAWLWIHLSYRYVWQSLAAIPGPALLVCSALPTPLTPSSWMTFLCWANPLWLLPNTPPLTGSNSHLLLKTRDVSFQDGFRNYLIMHKNSFCISKVHF